MTQASDARPAATIIILRWRCENIEVLMLKRSRSAGFFPDAWVFPGGRVDPADHRISSIGEIKSLKDNSFAVAGLRECFEEAGIWLGKGVPPAGFRDSLNQRQSTLEDAPMLVPDLSRLTWWSWWTTPKTEPKRYDTRFFLCCLNETEGDDVSHDNSELVEYRWIRPEAAIFAQENTDFFLAPPTLITLMELVSYKSMSEIWAASLLRKPREIMPIHRKHDGRLQIILNNHSDHPDPKELCLSIKGVELNGKKWVVMC